MRKRGGIPSNVDARERLLTKAVEFVRTCRGAAFKINQERFERFATTDRNTIRKHFTSFAGMIVEALMENQDAIEAISGENRFYSSVLKQLLKERGSANRLIAAVEERLCAAKFATVDPPHPRAVRAGSELVFFLLMSDHHIGSFVSSPDTAGLEVYNFGVYQKRLDTLLDRVLLFKSLHSSHSVVRKIILPVLGDVVEGANIYATQAYEVDRVVVDQVFSGLELWHQFLLKLCAEFEVVELFCVWGNHGRLGKEHPTRVNWDYVFYRFLQNLFREKQSNLRIYVSETPFMIFREGEKHFYLHHGDNVQRYVSLPFYGLDRMARRLSGLFRVFLDYVMIGHFHQPATLPFTYGKMFINGSMRGTSQFAIERLTEGGIPSQTLLTFHAQQGVTGIHELVLSTQPKLRANARGIFTKTSRGS